MIACASGVEVARAQLQRSPGRGAGGPRRHPMGRSPGPRGRPGRPGPSRPGRPVPRWRCRPAVARTSGPDPGGGPPLAALRPPRSSTATRSERTPDNQGVHARLGLVTAFLPTPLVSAPWWTRATAGRTLGGRRAPPGSRAPSRGARSRPHTRPGRPRPGRAPGGPPVGASGCRRTSRPGARLRPASPAATPLGRASRSGRTGADRCVIQVGCPTAGG
jgi:hypothetical protein